MNADSQIQNSRLRRWTLGLVLALGVVGGAAADAVITLRHNDGAIAVATAAAPVAAAQAPADLLHAAAEGGAAEMTADAGDAACSCVEGVDAVEARSPLAPRQKGRHAARRATPAITSLCAASH